MSRSAASTPQGGTWEAMLNRAEAERDRYREALVEITESRESFGDDRLYANHADRVAYNALNRSAS